MFTLLYINMTRQKALFFQKKTLIFKNSKNLLHILKISLISSKIFYVSEWKLDFHDPKGLMLLRLRFSICSYFTKNSKILMFIFFQF